MSEHNFKPTNGYVPDSETAIKIAEAVWTPIYGAAILQKRPFLAKLENDRWIVVGSLAPDAVQIGGVPLIEISKMTGEILRVSHGK